MRFYFVDSGTVIERKREAPIRRDLFETDAEHLAALAEVSVYPENIIEPTLEDWERRGAQSVTWNEAEKRVDVTWPVEEIPLDDYKKRLRRQVLSDALSAIEEDHEQTVLILAALGVIPNGMIASINADIQGTVTAAISKVQAIRQATTHADIHAAVEGV